MDLTFTEEEETFRQEVIQWLEKEVPQRWIELDKGSWEETDESWAIAREFERKLGQKGWLAPAFPKEFGGGELNTMQRLILSEELSRHRAPQGVEVAISVDWVAPTIMIYGNEEQKKKYVTGIAKGELAFCLGYSEPNSGSDLASLQTRAVEDGDGYVINGQKIWTSIAHYADYMWLAARTDPDVRKHRGISMFIVDMKTPGITVSPLINLVGHHSFNQVFLDDVRIPKENLVGEKNRGWYQLAVALDFERTGLGGAAGGERNIRELVRFAKETKRYGKPLAEDPLVRQELADMAIGSEIRRLTAYHIAGIFNRGERPTTADTVSGVASGGGRRTTNLGMHLTGHYGLLERDSKWAVFNGRMARDYMTAASGGIGGGTTEIRKNVIAQRGLGLPRG